jgi:hypothetical protein
MKKMEIAKYYRSDTRNPASCWLNQFEHNVYSQSGEDGVLDKIFELISIPEEPWFCEFGAWDGVHLSNSANLVKHHHWSGVYLEGNKRKYLDLKKNFSQFNNLNLINKWVDWVEGSECLLDNILQETPMPKQFDFLSIDIDGNDYHVWDTLNVYRPRVVCIEFNSTIPNEVYYIQENSPNVRFGSSLLAIIELGKAKGYELCYVNKLNAILVNNEEYPQLNIPTNSIQDMHFPRMDARVFQGYNGKVCVMGMDKLYWDLRTIKPSPHDFQYLALHKK